ncbi:hypothetical protein HZB01_04890 [Candidatus Woesearchaeota archaeon]|nr:hypothetical protein [Candidatus Woesearchaeota archaeon]
MKVPNGKLLIVKAEIATGKIHRVFLEGDFFFYPEEKLHLFEEVLCVHPFSEAKTALEAVQKKEGIQLVGITIDAIVALMQQIDREMGA